MEKLYYEDNYLTTFSATVTACTPEGDFWAVELDRTAFYPEGGGQACDIGTLGSVNVVDVQERGETIRHLCDGPLAVGSTVTGTIDWARRFDLMQQHTGEHIVSGLLHEAFGYHNTGFHVGKEVMEVDFDGPISPEDLAVIERKANEAIWKNLALKCWIPGPEELKTVTYRTKRELPWPVRIVQVPGYDSCACCGIHVKYTGEVGLIKILTCTKFHQGIRLEMVCGERAYRYMVKIFEENRTVSQTFSAHITATGAAAQKFQQAFNEEKIRAAGLQKTVFGYIAKGYVNQESVVHFEKGLEPGQVRILADLIAGEISGWCAVFSENENGFSYCLATRSGDLRQMNKALTAQLDGRGGGKPNFQQGSLRATKDQIEAFFHL